MKKLSNKQIEKLKPYWRELKFLEDNYFQQIAKIEERMSKELDIEDLEFFYCDGWAGIGNISRTIKLINSEILEK